MAKRQVSTSFSRAMAAAYQLPNLPVHENGPADSASLYQLGDLVSDTLALSRDGLNLLRRTLQILTSRNARLSFAGASLTLVVVGVVVGVTTANATISQYSGDINNPSIILNKKTTGTKIVDRYGVTLYTGYGAVERHNIPMSELPATIQKATLATEDPDFYRHQGFSWRGTARAMYKDLVNHGKVEGGSTITQQLVKNTLLTSEKSFSRKYKEIVLSMELERKYSKQEILRMYLNTIYYGEGAYGIESASQTYFHHPAKDLTLPESALLAGLPQSPSLYDPNLNLPAATARRNYVLERMRSFGDISASVATAATILPVQTNAGEVTIKAPHFVFYVLDQLRQQYGKNTVEKGGITVHTTLDYEKQQKAEQIVKNQVEKLSAAHHTTNGGLVSLDPRTGDIVSMVGSVDYNASGFGNVNVTLAQLQPGSSFKPIAYATAFTKGWNGATEVIDKPLQIPQSDGSVYVPQNYDQKFRGPVLLRRALANSLNIPALEVLQYAGIHDTVSMAHNLGITAPSLSDESRLGMSLVLGGGEVRPIDMATVYATFANGGVSVKPTAITKVDDRYGNDMTKPTISAKPQVLDPRVSFMLTNILSDNGARTEEFGANSPLLLSRPAAAKTGTTNDFRDNWTVGYTPDLVTAVWVGNNDHTPMNNVDGITGAAPIWHDYMEMAHAGTPIHQFSTPSGIVFASVCSGDGGLASATDLHVLNEVFLAGTQPTRPCKGTVVPAVTPIPTPVVPTTPVQQASAPATIEPGGRGGGGGLPNPSPVPTPGPAPAPTPGPPKKL